MPGTTPYEARRQSPEPERGGSPPRSTKPYGDRRDFPRGCGQHFSSRCRPQGRVGAALRGAYGRACTVGANSGCSCAAVGRTVGGHLQSKCLRSRCLPAAVARCSVRRRWQNSWWKCPPLCLSLRSSSSRWSRSLTFPFLILGGVLWHRTSTLQSFMVVVVSVEVVSKVFAQDRVLQRFLSRPFLQLRVVNGLVVFKVSLQDRVQQRFLLQNAFLSGLWSKTSIFPVEVLMVVQGFLTRQSSAGAFRERCLLLQFTLQLHLSLSSWRLLPQFMRHLLLLVSTLRLVLLVMMLHASSRILIVEGVDYHSGTCVMLDMVDFKWRSLGEGTYQLLRHSEGAKFFQFRRRRQLLVGGLQFLDLVLRGGKQRSVLAVAQP